MKHCSLCGREIPASATVCVDCEQWTTESLAPIDNIPEPTVDITAPEADEEPAAVASPVPPRTAVVAAPSSPAAPPPSAAPKRPTVMVLAGAVVLGGVLLLALVMFRGSSTSQVAAAPVAAAPVKPAAAVPPKATAPAPAPAKWTTENRAVWVGKRRNAAAFEVPADNMVAIWMKQVRPMLVVRCLSNSTDVFVFTASALQMEPNTEDHTVTFSFDDGPATSQQWPDGAEHDALFAPDGAAFAARLSRASTLRFGYTPHNARPVTATFRVNGLAELLAPLARECGSSK